MKCVETKTVIHNNIKHLQDNRWQSVSIKVEFQYSNATCKTASTNTAICLEQYTTFLSWALQQSIDFNQKTVKTTYDESIYKYHDICRFRGVTAVYGIDVNYGMLEVRPCAMLDMRLKQDSNEPVWKHRWTTSYCTFYMSHSLYNTTIHVNNTEQSNIRYNSLTYNKGKYINQNQTKYQLQWL